MRYGQKKSMLDDRTLCLGDNCPIKQNCYRFTKRKSGRQDFFVKSPYHAITNSCDYLINQCPDENKIRLRAYEIWQNMGYPDGKSLENWLQAERELRSFCNHL